MNKKLLLFTTDYCTVCPEMKAVYLMLKAEMKNISFPKPIDPTTEEGRALATKYKVRSIPALVYLEDEVQVGYLNGFQNKDSIIEMMGSNL